MLQHPLPIPAVLIAFFVALSAPAMAQDTEEAEERGLTSPDVRESVAQNPTDQGTRPPDELDEDQEPRLYQLLAQVRRSPPRLDADGSTPRPNALASEPAKEMPPAQAEEMSLFPENYVE